MADYKHGTYGEIVSSIGGTAVQSGTVAVYVGAAPVHLVRGYKDYVNTPIKLTSIEDVNRYCGYSEDWGTYDLCEAFAVHFKNASGNIGPIVVVNVFDPDTKLEESQGEVTFTNGRATIKSSNIVLDTLVLEGMVENVDYVVGYDFERGQVVIDSLNIPGTTETVAATYSTVGAPEIKAEDILGGVTDEGVYTGLGCVRLIYQEMGIVPNLILCPKWSEVPDVYRAMLAASTKINGHWDAGVYADIPLSNGTRAAAKAWKTANGYNSERSKVCWPQGKDGSGRAVHVAVIAAWATMLVDAGNEGVPMESPSNKAVPVVCQYFGAGSTNRGFDVQQANELNADGITTIVFWGGQWVLWGPHTAAYKHGDVSDDRVIFDTSLRMMFYVSNSFQADWAVAVDQPMTRAFAETIKAREQEKMDALAAMGAFVGKPVVEFKETANSAADIVEGNFTWHSQGTATPPFKSGKLRVAHTSEGYNSFFGEVQ